MRKKENVKKKVQNKVIDLDLVVSLILLSYFSQSNCDLK